MLTPVSSISFHIKPGLAGPDVRIIHDIYHVLQVFLHVLHE